MVAAYYSWPNIRVGVFINQGTAASPQFSTWTPQAVLYEIQSYWVMPTLVDLNGDGGECYCPSPLVMHSVAMRHPVISCASPTLV
jgi:hypothetical protein